MGYINGEDRGQMTLDPMCLDDYIKEDSICRVISAYVERLDLKAMGFKYAETKATGRPPFDPADMLSLYIYGYLNRVRSSRRLEAETQRNVEAMWLMGKLTPDDKTISNFRKDNAKVMKKVFREFLLWCNSQFLFGKELEVVDGTKIRANSSRRSIHTRKGTEIELAALEAKIANYMRELDENDAAEQDEAKPSAEAVREALKQLTEKKEKLNGWLEQIEKNGGEISTVDHDAHIMRQGGDGRCLDACYNVQVAADEKHKLIMDFEVTTCPDDKGALPIMAESAKEVLGVSEISVAADKGYYDGDDITECEGNGTTCYVPKIGYSLAPDKKYDHSAFKYNKDTDSYVCPEGAVLSFSKLKQHRKADGIPFYNRLYSNFAACASCPHKENCTKDKKGRYIYRNPAQDVLDTVDARMLTDEGRRKLKARQCVVEHPFGTIKWSWGYKYFLCRGVEKTTAEQSLAFLAYNLRRVINIFKANGWDLAGRLAC